MGEREERTRKLRFDEENLRETRRPDKGYGFMQIAQPTREYPNRSNPVNAGLLRDRLRQALLDEDIDYSIKSMSLDPDSEVYLVPNVSTVDMPQQGMSDSFMSKRQKFNSDEYLLSKQCIMATKQHPAGPSLLMGDLRPTEPFN